MPSGMASKGLGAVVIMTAAGFPVLCVGAPVITIGHSPDAVTPVKLTPNTPFFAHWDVPHEPSHVEIDLYYCGERCREEHDRGKWVASLCWHHSMDADDIDHACHYVEGYGYDVKLPHIANDGGYQICYRHMKDPLNANCSQEFNIVKPRHAFMGYVGGRAHEEASDLPVMEITEPSGKDIIEAGHRLTVQFVYESDMDGLRPSALTMDLYMIGKTGDCGAWISSLRSGATECGRASCRHDVVIPRNTATGYYSIGIGMREPDENVLACSRAFPVSAGLMNDLAMMGDGLDSSFKNIAETSSTTGWLEASTFDSIAETSSKHDWLEASGSTTSAWFAFSLRPTATNQGVTASTIDDLPWIAARRNTHGEGALRDFPEKREIDRYSRRVDWKSLTGEDAKIFTGSDYPTNEQLFLSESGGGLSNWYSSTSLTSQEKGGGGESLASDSLTSVWFSLSSDTVSTHRLGEMNSFDADITSISPSSNQPSIDHVDIGTKDSRGHPSSESIRASHSSLRGSRHKPTAPGEPVADIGAQSDQAIGTKDSSTAEFPRPARDSPQEGTTDGLMTLKTNLRPWVGNNGFAVERARAEISADDRHSFLALEDSSSHYPRLEIA